MEKNLFRTISFINLYSNDNKRLIEFYRDRVGLEPRAGADENHNHYAFNTDGSIFAIEPVENRKAYRFEFNKENPYTHPI